MGETWARTEGARMLPGSPTAVEHGCRCSGLANASYRVGATSTPLLDPECELHRPRDTDDVPDDG